MTSTEKPFVLNLILLLTKASDLLFLSNMKAPIHLMLVFMIWIAELPIFGALNILLQT